MNKYNPSYKIYIIKSKIPAQVFNSQQPLF